MQALLNPGDALALEVTQDSPSGIVAGRARDVAKARRSFTPAPSIVSLDSMICLTPNGHDGVNSLASLLMR
jgi:hypothetical protein